MWLKVKPEKDKTIVKEDTQSFIFTQTKWYVCTPHAQGVTLSAGSAIQQKALVTGCRAPRPKTEGTIWVRTG